MKRKSRRTTKPTNEKGTAASFWILPANRTGLKALSEKTGTSLSFLINRAVTRFLANPQSLFCPACHTDHTTKEKSK